MQLNFDDLIQYLPAGSLEVVGGKVKINCTALTNDNNLNSLNYSIVPFMARLLASLTELTDAVNKNRLSKPPIEFVEHSIYASGDSDTLLAESKFTCKFKVDSNSFVENVVDPTV
jgi:hypothetical protein